MRLVPLLALLLLVVACGRVGPLQLPAGTPPPAIGTDVVDEDEEFGD